MDESVFIWIMALGRNIVLLIRKDITIQLSQQKQAYSSLEGLVHPELMNIFQKAPLHGGWGKQKFLEALC